MERRDFVTNISLALAVACTAGLSACSKGGSDTPAPNPPSNPPGGSAKLTIDLSTDLKAVGAFKISNGVIIIRTGTGNTAAAFSALSSTCTHQGCTVATYDSSSGLIECNAPCGHGSRYTAGGAVATGPATAALAKYTITVSGNTLTVK